MRFSQRIGKKSVRSVLQIDGIDKELSNRLWNNIYEDFFEAMSSGYGSYSRVADACKRIWRDFLNKLIDEIPLTRRFEVDIEKVVLNVKIFFQDCMWYEKLDLIEFISSIESMHGKNQFVAKCNASLEIECSGYRIVNKKIILLNSEEEISAIEEAIAVSDQYRPVKVHLETSLNFLAKRKNPDYRNSIKESISAVEAYCKIVSENNKITLAKTLATFERNKNIHPSLKEAFIKLYGYTSDSGGIRHALTENDIEPTMEDAKFMLVSCSAFINYLKAKS